MFFAVLILEVIIAIISLSSLLSESNMFCSIIWLSYSNSSQYCVSSASLSAIVSLLTKSALLCAFLRSRVLAPMLVPERSICFESTNSCFSSCRKRVNLIILTANALLLMSTMCSRIYSVLITLVCFAFRASSRLSLFRFHFSVFTFFGGSGSRSHIRNHSCSYSCIRSRICRRRCGCR